MEQSERVAKFIVDCAEAANPKSDEEGEDLVEQCEETAKIFCALRLLSLAGGFLSERLPQIIGLDQRHAVK